MHAIYNMKQSYDCIDSNNTLKSKLDQLGNEILISDNQDLSIIDANIEEEEDDEMANLVMPIQNNDDEECYNDGLLE